MLNKKLAALPGYVPLEVDGIFGKLMDKAARIFQNVNKLTVDGEIGPRTWAAMMK